MRTLLYGGVVHRACEVCAEKWPCAKHLERGVGDARKYDGHAFGAMDACCPDCGYHVCSCEPVYEEGASARVPADAAKAFGEGVAEALDSKVEAARSAIRKLPAHEGVAPEKVVLHRRAIELIDSCKPFADRYEAHWRVDPLGWHKSGRGWARNVNAVMWVMLFFWKLHRRGGVGEFCSALAGLPLSIRRVAPAIFWDEWNCAYAIREEWLEDHTELRPEDLTKPTPDGEWVHLPAAGLLVWRSAHHPPPDWEWMSKHEFHPLPSRRPR